MHSHNYFVKSKIKLVVFSILILFLKVGSISSHEPVFDACPNLKNYSSELMVEILQIKSTIEQEKKNKLTAICYQYESFDVQSIRFKSSDRKNLMRMTGSKGYTNVEVIQ